MPQFNTTLIRDDGEAKYYEIVPNAALWVTEEVSILKEIDDDISPYYFYECGHFNENKEFVKLMAFQSLHSVVR